MQLSEVIKAGNFKNLIVIFRAAVIVFHRSVLCQASW